MSKVNNLRAKLIAHVTKRPGRTVAELAADMHVTKTELSRAVEYLVHEKKVLFKDSLHKYYPAPTNCLLADIYAPPIIPDKKTLRRVEFPIDWKPNIELRKNTPSIASSMGIDFKRYGMD